MRNQASIVIPLFNNVELTKKCWQSLLARTDMLPYEIIFVDNASSDATATFLSSIIDQESPGLNIISNMKNAGFAKACNQGARVAQSKIVVFLNNDTIVQKNWLSPLVEELAENPETGVVGCRLLYPDGSIQHAGVCIDRKKIPYHIFLGAEFNDPRVVERRFFRIVTGACMAVRKREFFALGGFDEEYVNGHEDVDLCLRYGELGKFVVYRPDSVVTHLESQSEGRKDQCQANTHRTLRRWHNRLMQDDFNYDFAESIRRTQPKPLSITIKIPATKKSAIPEASTLRAEAIARDLCRFGHQVQIHPNPDWGLDDLDKDIVIVFPGGVRYIPKPYARNVLWLEDGVMAKKFGKEELELYQIIVSPTDFSDERIKNIQTIRLSSMTEKLSQQDLEILQASLFELLKQEPRTRPISKLEVKVSILMGTFNRRKMLPNSINSVIDQTHDDWELIIINDGGEDVSDVVAKFEDKRIIYRNTERGGKGKAINKAFTLSSGKYVAYLDDDDIWHSEHLDRALFMLVNLPEVEMTYSDTLVTTQEHDGDGWRTVSSLPEQCPQVSFVDLLETNCIPGISVIHSRALFEKVGGMDEKLEVLIDFDMWRRLLMHTTPYHVSMVTAEHFIRPSKSTTGVGQLTNLHLASRRKYLANACRVLRKKMPGTMPEELRAAQVNVSKKVQALFLTAQGDYFNESGNYRRAVMSYKLAGKCSLSLCRKLIKNTIPKNQ